MARWWFFLVLLTPPPSLPPSCQSPASLGRAPAELSEPYSPPAQGFPQLPPVQPVAPPSPVPDDVSVCPDHGWSVLPRRADQVDP